MNFNLKAVESVQFGVGRDNSDEQAFCCVPVDTDVQDALKEMASETWQVIRDTTQKSFPCYEPSEKYSACEPVYLPLEDEMAERMRNLHNAVNLRVDQNALDDTEAMFCYFAKFTDNQNRNLTALKRSTQFKGVLKKRLLRLIDDTLVIEKDKIFKLDNDFDFLIDSRGIYILRPSSFESIGKLKSAILAAVGSNIAKLQTDLSYVDFGNIQKYATTHPRAARYLASIRARQEVAKINKQCLVDACRASMVNFTVTGEGKLVVDARNAMGFLEVLDRRRYEVTLIPNNPEKYRAPSRTRLGQ